MLRVALQIEESQQHAGHPRRDRVGSIDHFRYKAHFAENAVKWPSCGDCRSSNRNCSNFYTTPSTITTYRLRADRGARRGTLALNALDLIFRQILRPFGTNAGIKLAARARNDWERVAPSERLARVDHDARIASVGVAVIAHGVER